MRGLAFLTLLAHRLEYHHAVVERVFHRKEEHVRFLDQLRGIAILAVFLFHAFSKTFHAGLSAPLTWAEWQHLALRAWLASPFSFGWAGVAIFFVVSGFCIHLSHARSKNKDWWTFLVRRFFRIYPPYLVALLFFSFLWPSFGLDPEHPRLDFASHLLLIYNYWDDFRYSVNGAFWTIAVEVQLYLIYPVFMLLTQRLGWRGAVVFTLAIELFVTESPSFADHWAPQFLSSAVFLIQTPLAYWFCWSIGALIAEEWLDNRPFLLSRMPCWPFVALFLFCSIDTPFARFSFLFASLSTAVYLSRILAKADHNIPAPILLRSSLLGFIGTVSYSLYLLHDPFLFLGIEAGTALQLPKDGWLAFAVCLAILPVVLLLSWIYFKGIEAPSIAMGKKLLTRRRASGALSKEALMP